MDYFESDKQIFVLVGNSAATVSAIQTIRKHDQASKIILIGDEDCRAYSPVLETYYVAEKIDREGACFVDANFAEHFRVQMVLGSPVVAVDPQQQFVTLGNGDRYRYDALLIATGSMARPLNLPGEDLPGIFYLKTMQDADDILQYSKNAKDVVVVGGGFIGLQATKALHRADRNITLIEFFDRLLPLGLDHIGSRLLEDRIRSVGVDLMLQEKAISFEQNQGRIRINLDSGKVLNADIVVVGIGVLANTDMVSNTDIVVNRGIVVDAAMRTNYPNVYAAGDVAEGPSLQSEGNMMVPNWVNAVEQGKTAAMNMVGIPAEYRNIPENVTTIFDLAIAVVGNSAVEDQGSEGVTFLDETKGIYRKLHFNDRDEIDGMILIGETYDAGIIRNMIINRYQRQRIFQDGRYFSRNPFNYLYLSGENTC